MKREGFNYSTPLCCGLVDNVTAILIEYPEFLGIPGEE